MGRKGVAKKKRKQKGAAVSGPASGGNPFPSERKPEAQPERVMEKPKGLKDRKR